jgi:AcrR family transcriptional regulator
VGTAGQEHDEKQQDHYSGDDPKDLRPTWCSRWPIFGSAHAGLVVGLGVGGPISHSRSFERGCQVIVPASEFTSNCVDVKPQCLDGDISYTSVVPKLWNQTIEAHRREVRDAILDTTAALVAEQGLLSVTMSQIAEKTGIGRATLYKYFSDVEAILFAWHERQMTGHLEHLAQIRDQAGDPGERLETVLAAYALISHEHHGHHDSELSAFLHRDEQLAPAHQQLRDMIRDLLAEGAKTGDLRNDVAPDELASYCLHALKAASTLPTKAAVRRLVMVILAGLRLRA